MYASMYKESKKYDEIILNAQYKQDISDFNQNFNEFSNKNWKTILNCVSRIIIMQSYMKPYKNRIDNLCLINENVWIPEFDENDFITLKTIDFGSSSSIDLIYNIEKEEFCVIKKMGCIYDEENFKRIRRESNIYKKIYHPLIPKFYGTTKKQGYSIIEYINGKNLLYIKDFNLSNNEKITIIFELMLIIEFFHRYHYVYRDLKANNIMLDSNKSIVLIDFDRVVSFDDVIEETTKDFTQFSASEINNGDFSYASDIYSLGKMIIYIMNDFQNHIDIKKISNSCIKNNPLERPSILSLILEFYINYHEQILHGKWFHKYKDYFNFVFDDYTVSLINNIELNNSESGKQYILGKLYSEGKYFPRDSNKALQFFNLSIQKNNIYALIERELIILTNENVNINKDILSIYLGTKDSAALYFIGRIYYDGTFCQQNIGKAFFYFGLSADQHYSEAQFYLGFMYYDGFYIQRNINKAIYYFSLASNQNHNIAQYTLGEIFLNGEYLHQDIQKGIIYLTLSANNNYAKAQFKLGYLYNTGTYVEKNIDKSMYYYTLSANQNLVEAQFNLGLLYFEKEFNNHNLQRAKYYFSLAAKQNDAKSQFLLGVIFEESNIDLAINYYTLAANQNHSQAQFNLGNIFYKGQYVQQDIKKAIHYFTLASDNNNSYAQCYLAGIYIEGQKIHRNVELAIKYYSLAVKNKNPIAQYYLGVIYLEGIYVVKNFDKAFHLLKLSADQNYLEAINMLGKIFYDGVYVTKDLKKAKKYYKIAAEQNFSLSQYNLGLVYYQKNEMKKALYYFECSAQKGQVFAQLILGLLHHVGEYVKQDIDKAIHYYILASKQHNKDALFFLGSIYLNEKYNKIDINKGLYYLIESAKKHFFGSDFLLGFIYHQGKYIDQDIDKAIYYYKEASSLNDQYATNNLAIIYKNQNNIEYAIIYFKEAIEHSNDLLSIFNLSKTYFFDIKTTESIDNSCKLLIDSMNRKYKIALYLLCLILVQKCGLDFKYQKKS